MEAIIKGQPYDVKDGILNYHGQQLIIDQGRDEQLYITAKTSEGVFETLSLDAIAESADPVKQASYYAHELDKMTLEIILGEYINVKFQCTTAHTKWMHLNDESASELVKWLHNNFTIEQF